MDEWLEMLGLSRQLSPASAEAGGPTSNFHFSPSLFQAPPDMRFPNIRQGGGHGTWASIPPGTHRAASPGAFLWGRPHQPPTPPQPLSHAAAKAMACDALGGWMETLAFAFVSLLPSGQSTRRGISADDAHMASSSFRFLFFPLPSPLLSSAVLYSRYSTYFRHGPPSGSHRLAARLLAFLPACPTAEEVEGAMDAAQRIAPAAARLRCACPFVCSAVCPSCSPIARCGLKAGRAVAQTQRGRL